MPEALVRASLVIVAEKLAKDALEMIGTEDENVVQKLPSHRAHLALGESLRSRGVLAVGWGDGHLPVLPPARH